MSFLERLRNGKENGNGLTILIILNLFFLITNVYINSDFNNFSLAWPNTVIIALTLLASSFVIINLEKKGFSFAAHLLFFVIYLSDYLRLLFMYFFQNLPIISYLFFLLTILGAIASVYTLLKLSVHRNEIKTYVKRVPRLIYLLIILAILKKYFNIGLAEAVLYVVVFVGIVASANAKETLPLIIVLSFTSLLGYLPYFIYSSLPTNISGFFSLFLGIAYNLAIIYFAQKEYRKSNDYDDYRYVS